MEKERTSSQEISLKIILSEDNLLPSKISEISKKVIKDHCFLELYDKFGTNYKRKNFYHEKFSYTNPVPKLLSQTNGKKKYFHYVPIIETIQAMFQDKTLQPISLTSPITNNDVLKDFTDGSVFRMNKFFQDNLEPLKIILYQDGFEVVNPLGSAKGKYKLIAVYLSLGNLPPHLRTHIDTIQLVTLCKEKQFNHEKVYGPIVQDLKKIESEGIDISCGQQVKGTVIFISGDNLGNHQLGGFVENFSRSKFFCRYCMIERDGVSNNTLTLPPNV